MYGSIFRMKVIPGQEAKLLEGSEMGGGAKAESERAVASLVLKSDKRPGEFVAVAVFKGKASYAANANDPEQDKWFRR